MRLIDPRTPRAPLDPVTSTRTPCAHCGLGVPPALVRVGAPEQYCCSGCRAVRAALLAADLANYYDLRERFDDAATREPARTSERSYAAFDRDAFHAEHVTPQGELARVELLLEGVRCAACVWLVERLPRFVSGVVAAELRLRDARASITYDPSRIALSEIARRLTAIGYPVHPARTEVGRDLARRAERRLLVDLGVAAACAANAMLVALALYSGRSGDLEPGHAALFRWTGMLLGWTSLAWPGRRFLRGAWGALATRTANLDLPIALALVAGALAGTWNTLTGSGEAYFDSLTVLVFLLLGGRYIQARQQRFAEDAVDLTRALTPVGCRVVRAGALEEVTLGELAPGDIVEVRSGEPLPADGEVVDGASSVDRALLTGESEPVPTSVGDAVHAGSRNIGGTLRVRVDVVGAESRVGRLMGLVQAGLAEKPPIERFTDRIAGWFVVTVATLALGTFAWWAQAAGVARAVDHTVALLIVACPCALGLATPLTLAVAVGRAARSGLLVKDAAVFERLARGGRLLLDKTGTITRGAPTLVAWHGDASLRADVAAVEARSQHPLGQALAKALGEDLDGAFTDRTNDAAVDLVATDVSERLDGGVSGVVRGRAVRVGSLAHLAAHGAQPDEALAAHARALADAGCTVVGVARDGAVRAVLGLVDAPRDDARAAIRALRERGFTPEILSGDGQGAVDRVALEVGLAPGLAAGAARGHVEPEAKLARVRALVDGGETVVMVGDGVNDAAALAAAHVGIAVHGGAEASLAAADAYSSRPGLTPLVELVDLARRTLTTIHRNLGLSLAYNGVAVTLAMLGLVDPLVAAVLMPLSSASVLALALLSIRGPVTRPQGGAGCP